MSKPRKRRPRQWAVRRRPRATSDVTARPAVDRTFLSSHRTDPKSFSLGYGSYLRPQLVSSES